jgi:hypothetical protein
MSADLIPLLALAVCAMTGLGRSTLYRLIQQGKFSRAYSPAWSCPIRCLALESGPSLD